MKRRPDAPIAHRLEQWEMELIDVEVHNVKILGGVADSGRLDFTSAAKTGLYKIAPSPARSSSRKKTLLSFARSETDSRTPIRRPRGLRLRLCLSHDE
jgi:hypothetical protein